MTNWMFDQIAIQSRGYHSTLLLAGTKTTPQNLTRKVFNKELTILVALDVKFICSQDLSKFTRN
jgi:hypothetical protein